MFINHTIEWHELVLHQQSLAKIHLRDLFAQNQAHKQIFIKQAVGISLDFSRQALNPVTLPLLLKLADKANLAQCIQDLFTGKLVNLTEQQPALHMALRYQAQKPWLVNSQDIMPSIHHVLARMEQLVNAVWAGEYQGHTGKTITDVVNIGIGGSDLGPQLVTQALQTYANKQIAVHFINTIDPLPLEQTLAKLKPEQTLFIVTSKSFTTQETLYNAQQARAWLKLHLGEQATAQHFMAVTAKPERAVAFGIAEEKIYPFWSWVGGRYSLWSAVGLAIALSIGMANFKRLLAGAAAMDEHFLTAALPDNLPVLAGLLNIWLINFWHIHTLAVIPYVSQLKLLPAYLQQLEMESNGKRVTLSEEPVAYHTAPIIWGGVGTDVQHAFMQLLHQGTARTAVDFLIVEHSCAQDKQAHKMLIANALAQAQALVEGNLISSVPFYKHQPGNNPCSLLKVEQLEPYTLGALLAFYEHKVFVQGVIWNINPFDQWGVELSKELTQKLLRQNG